MVLMSIGMMGLYSMSVIQTRQANRLKQLLPTESIAINQAPEPWARKLGAYGRLESAVLPRDSVLPKNDVYIVDNQDGSPRFRTYKDPSDPHSWVSWAQTNSYRNRSHFHYSTGETGSWAQFRQDSLPPDEYQVFFYWATLSVWGMNTQLEIFDGASLLDTVPVDQTVEGNDLVYDGKSWKFIGSYAVNSGVLRARLKGGPETAFIVVDAMLLRPRLPPKVVSVAKTSLGGASAVLEPGDNL